MKKCLHACITKALHTSRIKKKSIFFNRLLFSIVLGLFLWKSIAKIPLYVQSYGRKGDGPTSLVRAGSCPLFKPTLKKTHLI